MLKIALIALIVFAFCAVVVLLAPKIMKNLFHGADSGDIKHVLNYDEIDE